MSESLIPQELKSGDFLASMSDEKLKVSDDKLVYQKAFFSFLDILGYKDLIDDLGAEAPRYIFKIIADAYQFHRASYDSVRVKILSDSVLIWSTTDHPVGFWNVLNVTDLLRGSFLKKGLLIRGGLSFGENFIHDDIIVSPALISAYKNEQLAVYPRIVIDSVALTEGIKNLIQKADGKTGLMIGEYFRICEMDSVRKDRDGYDVVSPFFGQDGIYCLKHGVPGWYNQGDTYPTTEQIKANNESGLNALSEMREYILKAKPKRYSVSTTDKYNYVVIEFNNFIEELGVTDHVKTIDLMTIPKQKS